MTSGPISSWQIDGEIMETVRGFIFRAQNHILGASFIAQSVKICLQMQETRVRFLNREDPLEKEMATHSSILPWRIPRTEEPGRLHSMGSQESDTT